MITDILAKTDTVEQVRDQIASILATEAGVNLRVFLERAQPWGEFIDAPADGTSDAVPIVNVSFDATNFDQRSSNVVDRQHASSRFHIDCYTCAVSSADAVSGGHKPGDEKASVAAMRAVRVVRNILMSGKYVYLGMTRGTVWRRWVESISLFQPQMDARSVQSVAAARITLVVDHNETAPQVAGEPLEHVYVTSRREPSGEIYFTAEFDLSE